MLKNIATISLFSDSGISSSNTSEGITISLETEIFFVSVEPSLYVTVQVMPRFLVNKSDNIFFS